MSSNILRADILILSSSSCTHKGFLFFLHRHARTMILLVRESISRFNHPVVRSLVI